MKTQFLTIATIATLLIGIATTTKAADKDSAKNSEVSTVLTNVSYINKIEVYGNVELYVSDAAGDQVKVYNHYYTESAVVQNRNGVLRISSYADQKLVVWVKAADLRTIAAYDNAEVKSFGTLSPIELNVELHNDASAKLNMNTYAANVIVSDRAKADLSGNAGQLNLKHDVTSTVNQTGLTSTHSAEYKNVPADVKSQDMATL